MARDWRTPVRARVPRGSIQALEAISLARLRLTRGPFRFVTPWQQRRWGLWGRIAFCWPKTCKRAGFATTMVKWSWYCVRLKE